MQYTMLQPECHIFLILQRTQIRNIWHLILISKSLWMLNTWNVNYFIVLNFLTGSNTMTWSTVALVTTSLRGSLAQPGVMPNFDRVKQLLWARCFGSLVSFGTSRRLWAIWVTPPDISLSSKGCHGHSGATISNITESTEATEIPGKWERDKRSGRERGGYGGEGRKMISDGFRLSKPLEKQNTIICIGVR